MRPEPGPAPSPAFRLLLLAYPAGFRRRFGREMDLVVLARRRELAARGGSARVRLWLEVAADTLRAAPLQRLESLMEGARSPKEALMNLRTVLGVVLVLLAAGHIAYDALNDSASMGGLAILVTTVTAVAGALLIRRNAAPPQRPA
jgi:hypothetical protein